MTDRTATLVLLAGLLGATPTGAAHAGDLPSEIDIGVSGGYRHSFGAGAGGLSLGVSLGGFVGPIGLEYESIWSNDHTFKIDGRVAGRNDNRLNLMVGLGGRGRFRFVIGAGGSLGWIKPPGKVAGPGERTLSQGAQEFIRFDFLLGDDDVALVYGVRVGASHRWQSALIPAPDHSVEVALVLALAPRFD